MGVRRAGRECAMQFLYQSDSEVPRDLDQALVRFWKLNEANASTRAFAEDLIRGVLDKRPEVDKKIKSLADHWDFNRLAAIDRNILRLAIYEMLYREEIPPVVSINEAIEIAKRFSTEESGRFVNGILDQVKKELLRPARHASGGNA
jgi:N utilization substance protein B